MRNNVSLDPAPAKAHSTGSSRQRFVLYSIVGLLYFVACATPAIHDPYSDFGDSYGAAALLAGWFELPLAVPWSANVWLLVGCVLLQFKNNLMAIAFGILAAAVGLSTPALLMERQQVVLGYYLWQGSLFTFTLGAAAIWWWEKSSRGVCGGPSLLAWLRG